MASPSNPAKAKGPRPPGNPVVYSDINIEKWSIFSTQKHRGQRVITRKVTLPGGVVETHKVTVGELLMKDRKETLTVAEAKVFYSLLHLWRSRHEENPDGLVHTSLNNLFNTIVDAGNKTKNTRRGNWSKAWIEEKIKKLVGILILYEFSYKNKDGSYRKMESFSLLQNADIFERKPNDVKSKFFDFSKFTIHPVIVKSILEKNVKPMRPDVLLQLQGEISIILYRFLDVVLFDKAQYERNVVDLAAELGFGASRRNNLLHQLREACAELEGKDLSHGRLDSCTVEKTADKRNWKFVAVKGRQRPALPIAEASGSTRIPDPDAVEETALLAIFDGLSPEEKQNIQTSADEIFRTKYRLGGELTRRYAILDALRERGVEGEKAQ